MAKKLKKKRKGKPLSRVGREMAQSFGTLPKKRPPFDSPMTRGSHWERDGMVMPYS